MSNNNEILVFHGIEASKIVNMWNALNINNSNLFYKNLFEELGIFLIEK